MPNLFWKIHLRKWTWNLKITCLKRKIIFQTFIFGVPCCWVSDSLHALHLTFTGCCGSTAIGMRFGGPWSEAEYTVDGRDPAPVEGKVVDLPLFTGFYTSQVVVWDFWTINSIINLVKLLSSWWFQPGNLPPNRGGNKKYVKPPASHNS